MSSYQDGLISTFQFLVTEHGFHSLACYAGKASFDLQALFEEEAFSNEGWYGDLTVSSLSCIADTVYSMYIATHAHK